MRLKAVIILGVCKETCGETVRASLLPADALDHLFIFRYLIQSLIADFFPKISKIKMPSAGIEPAT